ncbi:pentatricopeptide repeat-containing protein At1g77360, mitochondrial-like [Rhodamnia argentea]|uniref:Pentatricopeptide repeat-containing protein At1g77360, mitochondrial-like n=1 Tax=Rhodamnia argentea TaxID=178133 RepID=A0ABM3HFP1_9MYRT|nr:pentatricopeptide repeat-containing protein At1g77360, mitochondrial-like [Rhodamnia argentea]
MAGGRKRPYRDFHRAGSRSPPSSSPIDKKHRVSLNSSSKSKPPTYPRPYYQGHRITSKQELAKQQTFNSYLDIPNLPTKIRVLCEIIANTPSLVVEKVLEDSGIRVRQEDVEEVLKLTYGFPGSASNFFRWSGHQLKDDHSPYAWNLVVDMLGKNSLFDAMWDAVKSVHRKGLLSLATFASIFSSYVIAGSLQEAIMTFEVMDQYGMPPDVAALNSLFSAICRDGKTLDAVDFLWIVKERTRPDADTYAILLEGWENEGNVTGARRTFTEMVREIGWDPANVPAYSSFLCTLLKGPGGICEALKYMWTMSDHRCYPGMKFFRSALEECTKRNDSKGADFLWEAMVGRIGCRPDTEMYNLMIALQCHTDHIDVAERLLDEMVYNGTFPDDRTCNILLQFLIKCRKLKEASRVFTEMVKNECVPSLANCNAAASMFTDARDHGSATKVWKWMVEYYRSGLDETGNTLIAGLLDLDRLPEAVKYAEYLGERGIKLSSSTLSRLKLSLSKARKLHVYDELLRKWRSPCAA